MSAKTERPDAQAKLPAEGERLALGTHRLRGPERTCPAWPTLAMVEGAKAAKYTRWLRG